MTSQIDPAVPATGDASTSNTRQNFNHAKNEIEALQIESLANNKNYLGNPNARYWFRGQSPFGAGTRAASMWKSERVGAGSFTFGRSGILPVGGQSTDSFFFSVTTADSTIDATDIYVPFQQGIEGSEAADLAWGTSLGKPIMVSFWQQAAVVAGKAVFCLRRADDSQNYVVEFETSLTGGRINIAIPPPPVTTAWPADENLWGIFEIGSLSGSSVHGVNQSWGANQRCTAAVFNRMSAIGQDLRVTQLDMYEGTEARPWREPKHTREFVERYIKGSYENRVKPGTITTTGAFRTNVALAASTQNFWTILSGPSMRAVPIVTIYSPVTGVLGQARNVTQNKDIPVAVSSPMDSSFSVNNTVGADVALGDHIEFQWHKTAELI